MPLVPVEPGRQRLARREAVDLPPVPAPGRVHEGDDLGDVLDDAGLGPRLELEVVVAGVSLVPHLGDDAGLRGGRRQQFDFAKRLCERLLDVDVLPVPHRVHRRREMGMVGRGDDHGVELRAHLVEHRAEVPKRGNRRKQPAQFGGVRGIEVHVAEGDDLHQPRRGERLDHVAAAVADADERHAESAIGRWHPGGRSGRLAPRRARHHGERRASEHRSGHELAAAQARRRVAGRDRLPIHARYFSRSRIQMLRNRTGWLWS